jgi:protein-tyrosine kinase
MITSVTVNKPSIERASDRAGGAHQSESDLAGYYAALLRNVQAHQSQLGVPSFAVGITSCGRGEGVTTVAVNLAIAAARGEHRRVLIVDANAKHPGVARALGVKPMGGLADVLAGSALLGDCLQSCSVEGLSLLPAGEASRQLGADFDVAAIGDLLDELKSEYDFVVFDLPQADELSECYAFAQILNGVYLVVEAGKVDARVARRVVQRLEHSHANLLGAIYNKQP